MKNGVFMKKINVSDLQDGMITTDEVRTKSGQLIVKKGVALTRQLIMRISFYNITAVNVEDDHSEISEIQTPANPVLPPVSRQHATMYTQKVRASKEFQNFQFDHSMVLSSVKSNFEGYVFDQKPIQVDELLSCTIKLFDSCHTSLDLFDMLHNMRSYDDSTYAHSVNAALLSRRIGKWLKLDSTTLDTLTLCGLFHDIGKLKIPNEILNKTSKYTAEEFELVKHHPQYGYELLKPLALDSHIKKAALSHHERCDGSGYPLGLAMDDTDNYAMIVAIADVYDAMTSARSYRAPLCPFQVIDSFEQEGLQKYKPQFILTFLKHIATTYQNNRILLSDGRSGNIVMLNQAHLSKPIVQFDDGICIDLSTQPGLYIQSVL